MLSTAGMPMRDFTDSHGVHWIVWSTKPFSGGVLESLRAGWLTFVSPRARKRLIGIPEGWEDFTPERLETLCRKAEEVRQTPRGGTDTVDADLR